MPWPRRTEEVAVLGKVDGQRSGEEMAFKKVPVGSKDIILLDSDEDDVNDIDLGRDISPPDGIVQTSGTTISTPPDWLPPELLDAAVDATVGAVKRHLAVERGRKKKTKEHDVVDDVKLKFEKNPYKVTVPLTLSKELLGKFVNAAKTHNSPPSITLDSNFLKKVAGGEVSKKVASVMLIMDGQSYSVVTSTRNAKENQSRTTRASSVFLEKDRLRHFGDPWNGANFVRRKSDVVHDRASASPKENHCLSGFRNRVLLTRKLEEQSEEPEGHVSRSSHEEPTQTAVTISQGKKDSSLALSMVNGNEEVTEIVELDGVSTSKQGLAPENGISASSSDKSSNSSLPQQCKTPKKTAATSGKERMGNLDTGNTGRDCGDESTNASDIRLGPITRGNRKRKMPISPMEVTEVIPSSQASLIDKAESSSVSSEDVQLFDGLAFMSTDAFKKLFGDDFNTVDLIALSQTIESKNGFFEMRKHLRFHGWQVTHVSFALAREILMANGMTRKAVSRFLRRMTKSHRDGLFNKQALDAPEKVEPTEPTSSTEPPGKARKKDSVRPKAVETQAEKEANDEDAQSDSFTFISQTKAMKKRSICLPPGWKIKVLPCGKYEYISPCGRVFERLKSALAVCEKTSSMDVRSPVSQNSSMLEKDSPSGDMSSSSQQEFLLRARTRRKILACRKFACNAWLHPNDPDKPKACVKPSKKPNRKDKAGTSSSLSSQIPSVSFNLKGLCVNEDGAEGWFVKKVELLKQLSRPQLKSGATINTMHSTRGTRTNDGRLRVQFFNRVDEILDLGEWNVARAEEEEDEKRQVEENSKEVALRIEQICNRRPRVKQHQQGLKLPAGWLRVERGERSWLLDPSGKKYATFQSAVASVCKDRHEKKLQDLLETV